MAIEQAQETSAQLLEQVLIRGDLKSLNDNERMSFYKKLCESLGLNPLTRPFEYMTLQGKMTLYARKDATEQLRKINKVSITEVDTKHIGDAYIVTVKAQTPDGRCDTDMGVVSIAGAKGDVLANALMKAITKAKRRVTLSICGLGMLDETELETIPELKNAKPRVEITVHKVDRDPAYEEEIKVAINESTDLVQLGEAYRKAKEYVAKVELPEEAKKQLVDLKNNKKEEIAKKLSDDFFEEKGIEDVA